jgi:hypothetical protein
MELELSGVVQAWPPVADERLLVGLPPSLQSLLRSANGLVAYNGGLHIRGVGDQVPGWHSIEQASPQLLEHYRSLEDADVLFAEDAMGDQYVLRRGAVWRLAAETDDVERIANSLADFLSECEREPVRYLSLEPLVQLQKEGGELAPGQLIHAYPPFAMAESADGNATLRAVPTQEVHAWLIQLSGKLRDLPAGAQVRFEVSD